MNTGGTTIVLGAGMLGAVQVGILSADTRAPFATGTVQRLRVLARTGVAAHMADPLRRAATAIPGGRRIADLPVRILCCAASIEDAAVHWFDRGPVIDSVLVTAAAPRLLPPLSSTVSKSPRQPSGQQRPAGPRCRTRFRSWCSCCTSGASISR